MPSTGGESIPIADSTIFRGSGVRVSPDGRSVVFPGRIHAGGLEGIGMKLAPAAGGAPTWMQPWPYSEDCEWTPDGRALSYCLNSGAVGNVWRQPLDGGPAQQITQFDDLRLFDHAWSADGRTLFVLRGRSPSEAVLIRDFR